MNVREIATWLETEWWTEHAYPSIENVCNFSGLTKAQLELAKEPINSQLSTRGLPPVEWSSVPKPVKVADPEFVAACALLLDTMDKRSAAAKLKAIPGMTTRKFNALLAVPINSRYYKSRVNQVFQGAEDTAKISLIRNIENGDLQSIKHFHEMTGIYRPNQEIILNMGVLIARLMEVLAAHVDPKTLGIIGDKFDSILTSATDEVKELV